MQPKRWDEMRQDFNRIGGVFREHPLDAEKVRCHSEQCLLLLLFLFPLMCMIQLIVHHIKKRYCINTDNLRWGTFLRCTVCICNVLSLVNQPPDTLEDVHTMQTAAKYILCSVAAVQQFRQSCVIAMCSAEKPYFSHMSNDALGCGWGDEGAHLPSGHNQ